MTDVDLLTLHTATVEPFLGESATGPVYGPPVTVTGLLDDSVEQTPEAGGHQLVNKTTFYTRLDNRDKISVQARLTCNGRSVIVTRVRYGDGGVPLADVTHLEVDVT